MIGGGWWPLSLDEQELSAVENLSKRLTQFAPRLHLEAAVRSVQALDFLMSVHVPEILERDSLPHLSHVVNGWGNATYRAKTMIEYYADFVHRTPEGAPFIFQKDAEGDFHPWQSLAYAVMAGVNPDQEISENVTLRDLAMHSRVLNTQAGHELGHLLFALSFLDPHSEGTPFVMDGEEFCLKDLIELARESHYYGSFEVCRMFHMTEGICAAAHRLQAAGKLRSDAQYFLSGQLDVLVVLAKVLHEVEELSGGRMNSEPLLLSSLREKLIIGNFIENHCYYAGHILELAGLAWLLGYKIAKHHWATMIYVANRLNHDLLPYLAKLSFTDCFLHLGHYRRGLTLLAEICRGTPRHGADLSMFLRKYTSNLPQRATSAEFSEGGFAPRPGLYSVESPKSDPKGRLADVINAYTARMENQDFKVRGGFGHFRRIGPPHWPRAFHYEFLEDGSFIGVEVHLESPLVVHLRKVVRDSMPRLASAFPTQEVCWDDNWYRGAGRLRIVFGPDRPPQEIADAMIRLVHVTVSDFDSAMR
jgi:hypothetical protein